MSRGTLVRTLALAGALCGFIGTGSARAQDWGDYLHWPYTPPQVPGNSLQSESLYDGFYRYPREQRIVPQIQGPYYRNYYGGKRHFGMRHPHGLFHDWNKKKFYQGYHFFLDVF